MQKIYSLALLCFLCTSAFSEMPQWKKQIWVGSAVTVGGAGMLTGMAFTLPAGFALLDSEDDGALGPGIGMIVGGCLLLSAGIACIVAGPIVISHGVKGRHEEKQEREGLSLGFTPIHDKFLDKYQCSRGSQKFASVSFTF